MKVFTVNQIQAADAYTIEHEPISSIELMERAASRAFDWIQTAFDEASDFLVLCGVGNNGGDGFVIARKLQEAGKSVRVLLVNVSENLSEDCQKNKSRAETAGCSIELFYPNKTQPTIQENTVIIDAIFGSGLSRPIEKDLGKLINYVNKFQNFRIAIDIPSGLFADDNRKNSGSIFQAHFTLTFQFPKRAFFLPEFGKYAGQFVILPIGLHPNFIEKTPTKTFFLTEAMVKYILKPRMKFDHKGNYGHLLIVGGSKGKMGSCLLAAKAALHAGAGLVSLRIPSCGTAIAQTAIPEAMVMEDENAAELENSFELNKISHLAVGMGMGTSENASTVLNYVLKNYSAPLVLDADALNILSENTTWLHFLTPNSILTPHLGELRRLVGNWQSDEEMLEKAQAFAQRYTVYMLVKGAHSCLCCPDAEQFFNSTGNPGMATAGSGDTLAGIIGAFLAQGYDSKQAACMGMFFHGKAGDLAAEDLGQLSLIASSIIDYLPRALNA